MYWPADGCSVDGVSGFRVHGTCQRSGLVMDLVRGVNNVYQVWRFFSSDDVEDIQ